MGHLFRGSYVKAMIRLTAIWFVCARAYAEESKYANYSDRQIARSKTAHVEDAFLRLVLETQMLFCPYEDTCTLQRTMTVDRSCCLKCSCDVTTTSLNQCPDVVGKDNRISCLRPQYLKYKERQINADDSYLMISRCPKLFPDASIDKFCTRGNMLHPHNISMLLPVTDKTNMDTYKNIYCAICNSRSQTNLIPWLATVNCSDETTIDPKGIEELLEDVTSTNKCNFLFQPPVNVAPSKCETFEKISECNVTGKWQTFNEHVDLACTSYRSVYRAAYQNVFCYMCNVNDEPFRSCGIEDIILLAYGAIIPSQIPHIAFSATLNVSLAELLFQQEPISVCGRGFRYDSLSKTCRRIICTSPLVHKDGSCRSFYQSVSVRRYRTDILFRPHYNSSYKWCTSLWCAQDVRPYAEIYLKTQLAPLNIQVCRDTVHINAKLLSQGYDFPMPDDARLIYLRAEVEFVVNDNIDDVTLMTRLINGGVQQYDIKIDTDNISFEVILFTKQLGMMLMEEPVVINGKELRHILSMQTAGGEVMSNVCRAKLPQISFSGFTLLPKINASEVDFNITTENSSLCITEYELCFNPDEYLLIDSNVLLWSKKYFQRVDELSSLDTKNVTRGLYSNLDVHVSLVLICVSVVCLIVALVAVILVYRPRTTMTWMYAGLLVSLLLYNISLLSLPFPLTSLYSCLLSGAALQFTSVLAVAILHVSCLHLGLLMRTDHHYHNPYMFKIVYISYPVVMTTLLMSITYWYAVNVPNNNNTVLSFWGLSCYFATSSLSMYIACGPVLAMLAVNGTASLILVIYSYLQTMEEDIEFGHLFRVYLTLSFIWLIGQCFWFLVSYTSWTGNVYIFLSLNILLSLFIMLHSLFNSKLKNACTFKLGHPNASRDDAPVSGCPCNPVKRQTGDFRPLSSVMLPTKTTENEKYSCHL